MRTLTALALLLTASSQAFADNLPLTHPTVELVKSYFKMVVEQDWKGAAPMLRPASIQLKQRETINVIKAAPTMSEEAAMLAKLGVTSVKELEAMTTEQFYIADRTGFHNGSTDPKVQKQKKDTLKIEVLGVVGESKDTVAHLVVRTSQEVKDQRINELFFISFMQDEKDSTKWQIVPDMQRPTTEPLDGSSEAKTVELENKAKADEPKKP